MLSERAISRAAEMMRSYGDSYSDGMSGRSCYPSTPLHEPIHLVIARNRLTGGLDVMSETSFNEIKDAPDSPYK